MLKITNMKKLYSGIAGLMTVALVGTSINFSGEAVYAKETFQGIRDIVEDNSVGNRFMIVEVVPGTALYTIAPQDGTDPVELHLSLGELGYYIKGSEPAEFGEHLKEMHGSEGRYMLADAFITADETGAITGGALADITSAKKDNTKPLYYIPYEEDYNLTAAQVQELIDASLTDTTVVPWTRLEGSESSEQVVSRRETVSSANGKYLKTYDPKEEYDIALFKGQMEELMRAIPISANLAIKDMATGDYLGFETADRKGDFDPYFFAAEPGTTSPVYNVRFERNDANYGYRVHSVEQVYRNDAYAPDTYIYQQYTTDTGRMYYQYAGTFAELAGSMTDRAVEPEDGYVEDEDNDAPRKQDNLGDDGEVEDVGEEEDVDAEGSEENTVEERSESETVEDETSNDSGDVYEGEGQSSEAAPAPEQDSPARPAPGGSDSSDVYEDDNKDEDKSDKEDNDEDKSDKEDNDEDKSDKEDKDEDKSDKEDKEAMAVRPVAAHDEAADDEPQEEKKEEKEEKSGEDELSDFLQDTKGDHEDDEDDSVVEEMDESDAQRENVSSLEEEFEEIGGLEEDVDVAEEEVVDDELVEDVSAVETGVISSDGYYAVTFEYDADHRIEDGEFAYSPVDWDLSLLGTGDGYVAAAFEPDALLSDFVVPNFAHNGTLKSDEDREKDFLYIAKTPSVSDDGETYIYYGNYDLGEYDPNLGKYYRMKGLEVYYKGVYGNCEWFTQYVFDRDITKIYKDGTDEVKDFYPVREIFYNYMTVTPAQLASMQAENAGFVYVSAGTGRFLPEGAQKEADYSADNDILTGSMMSILGGVVNDDLPVMADYSIRTDHPGTNVAKLVNLLNQEDVSVYYDALKDSESSVVDAQPAPEDYFAGPDSTHHVNKSVYVYNFQESGEGVDTSINPNFVTEKRQYSFDTKGFEEIVDQIKEENLYRDANGDGGVMDEETVNEAVAIKYIISYRGRKSAFVKEKITVLELQPRAVEKYSDRDDDNGPIDDELKGGHLYVEESENTRGDTVYSLKRTRNTNDENANDSYLLKDLPSPIELVSMSTSEFVGRDADPNSTYDLIYIGLSNTHFNVDSEGRTVYNDKSMDGLLYTNIGDSFACHPWVTKASDTRNKARSSGNDLTTTKYKELVNFVESGYPVICDRDCFHAASEETTKVLDPDATVYDGDHGYIDGSSLMYKFLDEAKDAADGLNKKNFFRLNFKGEVPNQTMLETYLNLPKPEIVMDTSVVKVENYQKVYERGGKVYMDFRFDIIDRRSTDEDDTYDLNMYIDDNSDGKFSETEKLPNRDGESDGSKNVIQVSTSGGESIHPSNSGKFKLKPGKTYKVSYEVPEEYPIGPVAWKMVINLNERDGLDNDVAKGRRDEEIGCYFIWRSDSPKQDIKLLQIVGNQWNMETEGIGNGERSGATRSSAWESAMAGVADEYDLEVKSISNVDFMRAVASVTIENNSDYTAKCAKYLEGYDILALGFDENYRILDDSTDDTLSSAGVTREQASQIADGILNWVKDDNATLIGGGLITTTVDEEAAVKAKTGWNDSSFTPRGYNMNRRLRAVVGMDRYGVIERTHKVNGGVKAYEPNSNSETKDMCGLTFLMGVQNIKSGAVAGQNNYLVNTNEDDPNGTYMNSMHNTQIEVGHEGAYYSKAMNKGTIMLYPNALDKVLKLGDRTTYYTFTMDCSLDLECDDDEGQGDGTADVTVWLTYNGAKGIPDSNGNNARDLYYMFTKRNVTFIHEVRCPNNDQVTGIFTNAIITLAKTGKNVGVRFVEGPTYTDPVIKKNTIYVPYESIDDTEALDGVTVDAYYNPYNFSTIGTKLYANYYIEANEGDAGAVKLDLGGAEAWGIPLKRGSGDTDLQGHANTTTGVEPAEGTTTISTTYKYSDKDDVTLEETVSGYELDNTDNKFLYNMKIPVKLMDNKNDITIIVTLDGVVRQGGGYVIKHAFDKVKLVRRELFTLD